jgi:hypothetical protein
MAARRRHRPGWIKPGSFNCWRAVPATRALPLPSWKMTCQGTVKRPLRGLCPQ